MKSSCCKDFKNMQFLFQSQFALLWIIWLEWLKDLSIVIIGTVFMTTPNNVDLLLEEQA